MFLQSFQLQMQTPSGNVVGANNSAVVYQTIKINNPNKVSFCSFLFLYVVLLWTHDCVFLRGRVCTVYFLMAVESAFKWRYKNLRCFCWGRLFVSRCNLGYAWGFRTAVKDKLFRRWKNLTSFRLLPGSDIIWPCI